MRPWHLVSAPGIPPVCYESGEDAGIDRCRLLLDEKVEATIEHVPGPLRGVKNVPATVTGWFRVKVLEWRRG